jgi:hypothetical protein
VSARQSPRTGWIVRYDEGGWLSSGGRTDQADCAHEFPTLRAAEKAAVLWGDSMYVIRTYSRRYFEKAHGKACLPKPTTRKDLLIEAAMCAWEHVVEEVQKGGTRWGKQASRVGMAELRSLVASFAPVVHEAYEYALTQGYKDCFDWDFVPAFLEEGTNDRCVLSADWRAVVARVVRNAR